MPTDDPLLDELEDRWMVAAAAGHRPSAADLCSDRPDLLPALAARLAVQARFLAMAAVSATGPATSVGTSMAAALSPPPDTGRYSFLGFVARGGMGEVWRAFDGELKRVVAVKVLKPLAGVPADRFRAEAELVARLEHPGIVPVYDAGTLGDDRAFFAMKLIRGATGDGEAGPPPTLGELLTRRADPAEDLPRFIQVFQQACEAVAYAHALTPPVLHRDLKPANIMVGAFGEVLVMDWGIAKVLTGPGVGPPDPGAARGSADTGTDEVADTDRTGPYIGPGSDTGERTDTRTGAVKGTLAYMPPEQARGDWAAVGPATDVFALGGVLCAILTGRPPHTGRGPEVFDRARAGDLSGAHERLDQCGADPELVGIARRCLAADPTGRYSDAGELARTVAAYRAGIEDRLRRAEVEQVRAAGEQARAELAVREEQKRRRWQLSLGGAVVIALAVGLALSAWQAHRARAAEADTATQLGLTQAAERSAVEQKNEAVQQEQIATKVRLIFEEVLGQADHMRMSHAGFVPNPNLTVKEAIDNTIRRIDGRFDGQPLVEAEIRRTLGRASVNIGNVFQAEAQLDRAADLFRQGVGPDGRRTIACRIDLGLVLINRMKVRSAREVLQDAQQRAEAVFGPDDPLTLDAEWRVAQATSKPTATWDQGEPLLRAALDHQRRAFGADQVWAVRASELADAYIARKQFRKAEPLLVESLPVLTRGLGPREYNTLVAKASLGKVLLNTGRPGQGEQLLIEAIAGEREVLGDAHPGTVGAINSLAVWYLKNDRLTDAEPLLATAVAGRRKIDGPTDPYTMEAVLQLAILKVALGRYDEAVTLLKDDLAVFDQIGHRNFGYYDVQRVMGEALLGRKDYGPAEATLKAAYVGLREHRDELPVAVRTPSLWKCVRVLIQLYDATGNTDAAAEWRKEIALYPVPRRKGKADKD